MTQIYGSPDEWGDVLKDLVHAKRAERSRRSEQQSAADYLAGRPGSEWQSRMTTSPNVRRVQQKAAIADGVRRALHLRDVSTDVTTRDMYHGEVLRLSALSAAL